MTRQEHLVHLRSLVHKDIEQDIGIVSGSWKGRLLSNLHTGADCQIFEIVATDDKCEPMPVHVHVDSQEVFYQVTGTTTFQDGQMLRPGEIRVFAAGVEHSLKPDKDSKIIVIYQPIDKIINEVYKQTLENK